MAGVLGSRLAFARRRAIAMQRQTGTILRIRHACVRGEQSIRPVLHLQARHRPKVLEISRDQRCLVGESDARDQQVVSTYFPEFLVFS